MTSSNSIKELQGVEFQAAQQNFNVRQVNVAWNEVKY